MIPILNISKLQSSLYEARVESGGQLLTEPVIYSTIAEAIAGVGHDVPENFGHFMEIYYSVVSVGTISTAKMQSESNLIADKLVALCAEVMRDDH